MKAGTATLAAEQSRGGLSSRLPRLAMHNVTKSFPGVRAVDDVSLEVRRGEVHALIGENGAGKSTLMHLVAGVYQPDTGTIELDGASIAHLNEKGAADAGIAMVYQERSLVGALSVAENVYAGRQPVNNIGVILQAPMYEGTQRILADLEVDIDPRAPVCSVVARPAANGRDCEGPLARAQSAYSRRAHVIFDDKRRTASFWRYQAPCSSGCRSHLCLASHGRGLRNL